VFEGVLAGCGFAGLSARAAFGIRFGFVVKRVGVKSFAHKGFPGMSVAGVIWVDGVILLIILSEYEVTISVP
jgi:hypothetical protein